MYSGEAQSVEGIQLESNKRSLPPTPDMSLERTVAQSSGAIENKDTAAKQFGCRLVDFLGRVT